MDNREEILGFKPQKEPIYNKLLPYHDKLDSESNHQLAEIKANLSRSVLLRDIKTGACHWTGQLSKYIRLYGHKYSKDDHLAFIRLLFELTTLPRLDFSLAQKFATLLIALLKKKELISRDDLVLPWRPLYDLVESVSYSRYEHHGLVLMPSNVENILKALVRVSRRYFSEEATSEMLDEWRPLMCPLDITMIKAMYYFELFLPTTLPPDLHDKGFKLWLDELLGLWDACQNSPQWEGNLVNLFARLALQNIGYINWEPWLPKIMTRIIRSFNLPVGSKKIISSNRSGCNYDVISSATWIVSMMGGQSQTQTYISKMFVALESFYHPSNFGKWNGKLMRLMVKLPHSVVRRRHRERHPEQHWEEPIPVTHQLTEDDVTAFVTSMKPIVFLAMFSKSGSHDSAVAMDQLAQLRPELIIPQLLEHTYPAMETLTEPHRLIASLNCTVTVARSMLNSQRWFPEGRTHVLPLLNLTLPGIDPNDVRKCLTTFQLVSTLASLVPIVDCSQAINLRTDLTETERELCSASAQFQDFVLLFMDKLFALIENCAHEHTRTDSMASDRLDHEETMLEVGLLSTFNAIMQQSSPHIYREALSKLFRFVTTSIYEIRVAGRFASDLCRAAAKVNPDAALKLFLSHFCDIILNRTKNEDLAKEEHLDNEFLWNLKLLSETVRCDGRSLLRYGDKIMAVLSATLHLKCKDGADLAGNLLRHVLKALTLTYACDYRSTPHGWDKPLDEYLPIRDWGKPGDPDNLGMKWHVPSPEEKQLAGELLQRFLVPELTRIQKHIAGQDTLSREDLQQTLSILVHCVVGAGAALSMWQADMVSLVECQVDLTRFPNTASSDPDGISLNGGENVRLLIVNTIRPLLDHLLSESEEDDTKSVLQLIRVYNSLMFYHGTLKEEFDSRWKSLHVVKRSMENRFLGKKKHIRAVLVDRVQLQHELRIINRHAKTFTTVHRDLFADLLRLSVSRYGEVRKSAQSVLSHGFHLFAYSYRALLDDILVCLKDGPEIPHHKFKGALYIVKGEHKRSLVTKRNWEVMNKVWLAVVQAQHSEKPSIHRLVDDITDKLHKNIESTELDLEVNDRLLTAGQNLWESPSVTPSRPYPSDAEQRRGLEREASRNTENIRAYRSLCDNLITLIDGGALHWKFNQLAVQMLSLLVRYDIGPSEHMVRVFTKNMVHDSITIRKISIGTMSAILKAQKRKHVSRVVDPFSMGAAGSGEAPAGSGEALMECGEALRGGPHPGDRPDNAWIKYNQQTWPQSVDDWNKVVCVEKTHWGYYCWPKEMRVYAPSEDQPRLGRSLSQLPGEERPIYEHFTDSTFIDKLVKFMSLEEHKGKDKFRSKHFTLFKGLFRNFDISFTPLIRPHLERLVADTRHDSHECSQRLAAEMIAGVIRGSKHWTYNMMDELWTWLIPVIKTAVTNVTIESIGDWGTCFATAAESRDPRKLAPMLELLVDRPLSGDGGSFGDSSRLYMLQGALAQQEWRIPELLHRHMTYITGHLTHPYKNVRDRMGSVIVNLLMHDFPLPGASPTHSPLQSSFLSLVLPQLKVLLDTPGATPSTASTASSSTNKLNGPTSMPVPMEIDENGSAVFDPITVGDVEMGVMDTSDAEDSSVTNDVMRKVILEAGSKLLGKNLNGESEERKVAVRLCKTVMKFVQGGCGRMMFLTPPEIFQLIPILCNLESEQKDDELRKSSFVTLACMAQSHLTTDVIPVVIDTISQVSEASSWHARASILGYMQVMVFSNLFLLQDADIIAKLQSIALKLLCDEQVEVRELAAVTLGGFLHCGYMTMNKSLMDQFESLSSTKLKKSKRAELNPDKMIKRHAGVLGLSACVLAFPYDVPEFIPQILMDLSDHLGDPQPIQLTVKKTLSNFRRTHYDNWQDHKQKFTDDQLVVLTDVLISPNYYA